MSSRPVSRTASVDAPPSQTSRSPSNSGWELEEIKPEIVDEADSPVAEPLSPGASAPFFSAPTSPAAQFPAADSAHDQPVSMSSVPVIQHSLAEYYRSGAYSDLEVVTAGITRSVHRIVVCSESPVLRTMCSNLGRDQRLELNQYDSETLDRVLDFCYRRTYSDGEYPETVAPFLTRMTAADIHDALEVPLAVVSDVKDREGCLECDMPDNLEEEQEFEEQQDHDEEQNSHQSQSPAEEPDQADDSDEYIPCICDIHFHLVHSSVYVPAKPHGSTEAPKPPYAISLFANFMVYIAAKELQMPALQLVARERFAHSLQAHWYRFAALPALIEQVYLRTDKIDPLRMLVCQVVAAAYDSEYEMACKAEIRELMTKIGEFAAEVLDTTLRLRNGWTDTWA